MMSILYPTHLLTTIQKKGEMELPCSIIKLPFASVRLSLGMSGFEQQASGAVLDMMQDEEQDMKRLRGIKKWYGINLF